MWTEPRMQGRTTTPGTCRKRHDKQWGEVYNRISFPLVVGLDWWLGGYHIPEYKKQPSPAIKAQSISTKLNTIPKPSQPLDQSLRIPHIRPEAKEGCTGHRDWPLIFQNLKQGLHAWAALRSPAKSLTFSGFNGHYH